MNFLKIKKVKKSRKNAYGQNGQADKMPTVYNKAG